MAEKELLSLETTKDASQPAPRVAQPHRCNDRLEDFVEAIFTGNFTGNIFPTWGVFQQCLDSAPGNEPTVPFRFHTPKLSK
mmetsp:Transcript_13505/g.18518  ORF Transcript_13505/g.18518 Transcript_13505/m.18518 type:complete len:81 (+) Transcript_13505:237-479(+)